MDSTTLQKYKYENLSAPDAVRVLILKPAVTSLEPLRCDIIQYRRSEIFSGPKRNALHYTAISYAWGEPDFSRSLLCNGDSSVLSITPNIESLLLHLRKKWDTRCLWIDAICLNQDDKHEIAAQIPHMGEIFGQARKVRIWIGNGDENSNALVFTFLRALPTTRIDYEDLLARIYDHAITIFGDTSLDLVNKFFSNPYFFRRWILQEVKLARQSTVHYGSESMPWLWLASACAALSKAAKSHSTNFQLNGRALAAVNIVNALSNLPQSHMLDYLWHFHASECRDTRDRIFSLYGLVPEKYQCRNIPTSPSLYMAQLDEIFRVHTLAYIGHLEKIFQHLCVFGSLATRTGGDLSWVPDWSCPRRHNSLVERWEDYSNYDETLFELINVNGESVSFTDRSIGIRFYSYVLVTHSILKVGEPFSSWKDVLSSLYSWRMSCPPRWRPWIVPPSKKRFRKQPENISDSLGTAFCYLTADMIQRLEADEAINKIMKKYSATKGKNLDLYPDLQEIWDNILDHDNVAWTISQIYLLEALRRILQKYKLFCQIIGSPMIGFGPLSMEKGNIVSPLWYRSGRTRNGGCRSIFHKRSFSAAVLQLDKPYDIDSEMVCSKNLKARLLGFSAFFYQFSLPRRFSPQCFKSPPDRTYKALNCTLL
jgi:Heterokaryon incompatibility protein (HET)